MQAFVNRFFVEGVSLGFRNLALILHDLFASGADCRNVLLPRAFELLVELLLPEAVAFGLRHVHDGTH